MNLTGVKDMTSYPQQGQKSKACDQTVSQYFNSIRIMHRAGQRCFELLALIGSPQLSFSKVFPAEQTSWPNWQTLWACTEADAK